MPELPEVEFATRNLRAAIAGRTIARVRVLHPALRRSLPPAAQRRMAGRTVHEVTRRAKLQLLTLDDGATVEVHFRMTGDWAFGTTDDPMESLERARIELTDGTRVSLIDGRAFAVIRFHAPGAFKLPPLGLEPLDAEFTGTTLRAALAPRRITIKQALLDQKVVAGLGNIYAAEALWEAKIAPTRVANRLTARETEGLAQAIRTVLERAPAGRYYFDGSASDDPDDDPDGEDGGEHAWRVYDREGDPCRRCGGKIRRITQGGRSTFFCPRCQRSAK
jgi:formamidopyrimidine-DNA glycosylase